MDKTDYIIGGKILNAKVISDEEPVITQEKSVEITQNGITLVEPDKGYNAMTTVEVTTNVNPDLESKSVTITSNGTSTVTPTAGKDGLSSVEITTNVTPPLESKTIEFTENGTTIITPTEGKYGLSSVEVTVNTPYVPDLEKDVNFFDYDGTLLYAYTKSEFLALESLPAVPTHNRLTSGSWNWTLSEAKTFVTTYGWVDIGACYEVTSGKNEVDVEITQVSGKTIKIMTNGTKDWGDGTTDSLTEHTYTDYGSYTIVFDGTLNRTSDTRNLLDEFGDTYNANTVIKHVRFNDLSAQYLCYGLNELESVVLGSSCQLYYQEFYSCYKLKFIAIRNTINQYSNGGIFGDTGLEIFSYNPNNNLYLGTGFFNYCYNLKRIIIKTSNSQTNNLINRCTNLEKAIIISTNLGSSACSGCINLKEIKFSDNVTYAQYAKIFYGCSNLLKYDYTLCTSVPSIQEATFNGVQPNAKIVVPDSLYNSWISATNWSNYSDLIVRESDYQE